MSQIDTFLILKKIKEGGKKVRSDLKVSVPTAFLMKVVLGLFGISLSCSDLPCRPTSDPTVYGTHVPISITPCYWQCWAFSPYQDGSPLEGKLSSQIAVSLAYWTSCVLFFFFKNVKIFTEIGVSHLNKGYSMKNYCLKDVHTLGCNYRERRVIPTGGGTELVSHWDLFALYQRKLSSAKLF